MPTVNPWHSTKQFIHHNHTECQSGKQVGVATLIQTPEGVRIAVTGYRLPPGVHGLHIHAVGTCQPPEFTTAGAHFNPAGKKHGTQSPDGPHAGDLPNMTVAANGEGGIDVVNKLVSLGPGPNSLLGANGTSIIIHAAADDISDQVIEVVGEVRFPPDEAWALWSSSDGLARWWTENTRIDLRPGGSYEIHFDAEAPPGFRGADWCRVLSFLPGRMLSFTWNAPDTLATRPRFTFVVVLFEPLGPGSRVTLSHLGWPESGLADPGTDWQATFDYFSAAWQRVMGRFVDYGA